MFKGKPRPLGTDMVIKLDGIFATKVSFDGRALLICHWHSGDVESTRHSFIDVETDNLTSLGGIIYFSGRNHWAGV